jgi:hypothetical protein
VWDSHTLNPLRRGPLEMIHLPLIRRPAAMPKEQPLQALIALQLILEPESILPIRKLEQIQQLRRGLHDGERRGLGVVDDHRDAPVRVQAQEPFLLLDVGVDVEEGVGEGGGVGEAELFEEDLHLLAVGGGLG